MRFMLDTNICIYVIKKKPVQVLNKFKSFQMDELGISAITMAELEFGVQQSSFPEKNLQALRQFVSPLEIAPFDDRAAFFYGEVRGFLQSRGLGIGPMDMLIAAHARSLSIPLVTNNEREFKRIPDFFVENWVKEK